MSNYLCQNCKSNNNGWCTVRKCNGLKKLNITSCNTYESNNSIEFANGSKINIVEGNSVTRGLRANLKMVDDSARNESEANRALGKRQMLWNIQRQIIAINKENISYEEKYKSLITCVKSIGIHLEFEENIWNMDSIIDNSLDGDMVAESKYINSNLL